MTQLINADKPNLLGKKKKTKFGENYTVKLSSSHRLAFPPILKLIGLKYTESASTNTYMEKIDSRLALKTADIQHRVCIARACRGV